VTFCDRVDYFIFFLCNSIICDKNCSSWSGVKKNMKYPVSNIKYSRLLGLGVKTLKYQCINRVKYSVSY
jgi:hypothetical protein